MRPLKGSESETESGVGTRGWGVLGSYYSVSVEVHFGEDEKGSGGGQW